MESGAPRRLDPPVPSVKARSTLSVIVALAFLYTAQGIPFGFATEYLPVVLREEGYSYAKIAALFWLQLPWQLKVVWAKVADYPRARERTRSIILVLQLGLTATVAAFAIRPLHEAPILWFGLTALAAALAATQDVFVDAFAVRVLSPSERGYGNTAQVAGYRVGMLIGGAALLVLVSHLGERTTLLCCAAVVAAASIGAFVGSAKRDPHRLHASDAAGAADTNEVQPLGARALVRHMLRKETRTVLALALTFKLGLHMASSLLKPMLKDFGWSKERIGWAAVTVGSAAALAGAAVGGFLHRKLGERRALFVSVAIQALVCVPLIAVERLHAPLALSTVAIAFEHFGSGLGTTVLFAALMSATRPSDAGLHYTVLTSANALAIGIGSLAGGSIADHYGLLAALVTSAIACVLPAALLPRWSEASRASAS